MSTKNNIQRYTGCNHIHSPNCIISMCNESVLLIDTDGKKWLMEWHHYFGPSALKKNGDPLMNQPGEHSRFWKIATWWNHQGCKVVDGVGIWKEPPKVKRNLKRVGRQLVEVDSFPEIPGRVVELEMEEGKQP